MKLNFFSKIVFLFCIMGIGSSFYGCLRCPEDQFFDIDKIDLSLFWSKDLEADQQYRDYIGIGCKLADSKAKLAYNRVQPITLINSAYAWSCDTEYYLRDSVKTIRILTIYDLAIYDMTQTYEAGSDVTDLFLFRGTGGLHSDQIGSVIDFIQNINNQKVYYDPIISFNLILDNIVKGEFAGFEIELSFSGGQTISGETPLIQLVDR